MDDEPKKYRDADKYPVFLDIAEAGDDAKTFFDDRLAKLMDLLEKKYMPFLEPGGESLDISENVLMEIFERVEKRRIYFHIFHKCKMGELNEGALFCFWIAKLQPFHHPLIKTSKLNARLAAVLFANTIAFHLEKTGQKKEIPGHFGDSLVYALLYRDISKEALMILAESFLDKKPD